MKYYVFTTTVQGIFNIILDVWYLIHTFIDFEHDLQLGSKDIELDTGCFIIKMLTLL